MKKETYLSKLFHYAGTFKYLTILAQVLSAVSALIALVPFVYIWKVMDEVLRVAPEFKKAQSLAQNGWAAVLFALLSMIVYIVSLMCSHIAAFRVQRNIRTEAMQHILTLPLGFMNEIGSGKLRKTVNESSAACETYLAHQLPDRAGAIVTPAGLLILLLWFDWRLGLLSLIPVAVAFLVMSMMTGQKMQEKMSQYQDALGEMSNQAVEYVRGIPVVKTFGQSVFSFKRFRNSIADYEKWVIAYTKELRRPMMIYTTAVNGVFAILIAAALVMTSAGVTNKFFLNLLFYIIITPVITVTLTKIMFSSEDKMIMADAVKRIDEVMAMEPLSEPAAAEYPKDCSVKLNQISYRYPDAKENALQDITIEIKPGEHVAFVGPSGGGKTTLANMIARFFDPLNGTVHVGGVDVRNIPKKELMETVSFVFQDSKLLKMSVLDNVKLSNPYAEREEVIKALHAAQCDDILKKLPNGIDTVIGADGVYLSGGEQQRIAIARVMLKDAPIVIMDEASAFADPDNEAKVQAAFAELSKGKTVIMIAHRLSTVTGADRIYLIDSGSIREEGTHEQLLEKSGFYAQMWTEYNCAAKWKVGA